ncbi:MAG: hypothetical protein RLZZ574_1584 [Cyanobacteriota bacterium]
MSLILIFSLIILLNKLYFIYESFILLDLDLRNLYIKQKSSSLNLILLNYKCFFSAFKVVNCEYNQLKIKICIFY